MTTTGRAPERGRLLPHVRLYESVRTAHLERARELSPASIVYRVTRYDFDDDLAAGLHLVRASPLAAARLISGSRVERLEINEPLMLSSLPSTALVLAALALRPIPRGRRPKVVAYAIGNDDPFAHAPGPRLRSRIRRRLERLLAQRVYARVDRIAYGTSAAETVYRAALGPGTRRLQSTIVPALPERYADRDLARTVPGRVVFVGALAERKGVRVLLDAWPAVAAANSGATLLIVGKGPLEALVSDAATRSTSIAVEFDPPREVIHHRLDEAVTLVLPSQPSATWREQVGLPIVEALSHGCRIVTTTETGLAEWLAGHGHEVVEDATDSEALAGAILRSLDSGPSREDVLAALPPRDGRLAADDWLSADGRAS